jgi:hypothetical protein
VELSKDNDKKLQEEQYNFGYERPMTNWIFTMCQVIGEKCTQKRDDESLN